MYKPTHFQDLDNLTHVWKLDKAIYVLKQALRSWFDKLSTFLREYMLNYSKVDPSLLTYILSRWYYASYAALQWHYIHMKWLQPTNSSHSRAQYSVMHERPLFSSLLSWDSSSDYIKRTLPQSTKYNEDILYQAGMNDYYLMSIPLPLKSFSDDSRYS